MKLNIRVYVIGGICIIALMLITLSVINLKNRTGVDGMYLQLAEKVSYTDFNKDFNKAYKDRISVLGTEKEFKSYLSSTNQTEKEFKNTVALDIIQQFYLKNNQNIEGIKVVDSDISNVVHKVVRIVSSENKTTLEGLLKASTLETTGTLGLSPRVEEIIPIECSYWDSISKVNKGIVPVILRENSNYILVEVLESYENDKIQSFAREYVTNKKLSEDFLKIYNEIGKLK